MPRSHCFATFGDIDMSVPAIASTAATATDCIVAATTAPTQARTRMSSETTLSRTSSSTF